MVDGWHRIVVAIGWAACCMLAVCATAYGSDRHFELVSPTYKGSYGVNGIAAVASDGEGLAFRSQGTFAGDPRNEVLSWYLARRGAAGWSTFSLEPPASLMPDGATVDVSSDLTKTLFEGCYAPNLLTGFADCHETVFLEHGAGGVDAEQAFTQPSISLALLNGGLLVVDYKTASANLCQLIIGQKGVRNSEEHLTREAVGTEAFLYQMSNGCGSEPSVGVLGLNNSSPTPAVIDPNCAEQLGGYRENRDGSKFDAVSSDGSEVFFTAFVNPAAGRKGCEALQPEVPNAPAQLFARLGGRQTLEVSRPIGEGPCESKGAIGEVPCEGAEKRAPALFWGASRDGSHVYFASKQPLTGGGDTSDNLFLADIGCPEGGGVCAATEREVTNMTRVSQPVNAADPAEVQGVVRIAPDGSHVYFVAHGVLAAGGSPENGSPVRGADNLYGYDANTGATVFVARLCSGPNASGTVDDRQCPSNLVATGVGPPVNDDQLWAQENETKEAQVNVCGASVSSKCSGEDETGRYLVFATYGRLLKEDTDGSRDVYRFDSGTGSLVRVSLGEAGADNNGNCGNTENPSVCDVTLVSKEGIANPTSVAAQYELADRAVSEDGSRVVFTTADSLSEKASNGVANVYEWHWDASIGKGVVSIVSSGSSPLADSQPVITPSGRDVFFVTSAGLTRADGDGMSDVYDARLGVGFAPESVSQEACEGEACYGPLSTPVQALVPGSTLLAGGSGSSLAAVPNPASGAKTAIGGKHKSKHRRRRRGKKRRVLHGHKIGRRK